jgi:hypothetical protein
MASLRLPVQGTSEGKFSGYRDRLVLPVVDIGSADG